MSAASFQDPRTFELGTIDGLAPGPVEVREVATLTHEAGNHTMEDAPLVVEWFTGRSEPSLTSAQRTEILCRLGRLVCPQFHYQPAL